jgi:hypothetical protein
LLAAAAAGHELLGQLFHGTARAAGGSGMTTAAPFASRETRNALARLLGGARIVSGSFGQLAVSWRHPST